MALMHDDIAQVLDILGAGKARESELQAATGWPWERLHAALNAAKAGLHAKRVKSGGTADSHWIACETIIARCPWQEADVLAALRGRERTATELVQEAGAEFEPLRMLLARMERDKKIKRIAVNGLRKWVPASRKVAPGGKLPAVRLDRLLKLIEKHQPVRLAALAEMVGRGVFYTRGRLTILRERGLVKYDVLGDAWRYVLADYQRPAKDIGGEILMRCEDAGGDCLAWSGARDRQGHPLMRHQDNIRRVDLVLWTVVHGKKIKPGHTLVRTCETPGCCNHEHHKQVTRGEAMRIAFAELGEGWARAQGRRVSQAMRAKVGVLSEAQVERALTGHESASVLAKEFGCAKSVISCVRRGETYKDYGAAANNPFTGLLGRAAA